MKKLNLQIPSVAHAALPILSDVIARMGSNNPSKALFVSSALAFAHFYKQINPDGFASMFNDVSKAMSSGDLQFKRFRIDADSLDPRVIDSILSLSANSKASYVLASLLVFECMLSCNLVASNRVTSSPLILPAFNQPDAGQQRAQPTEAKDVDKFSHLAPSPAREGVNISPQPKLSPSTSAVSDSVRMAVVGSDDYPDDEVTLDLPVV